MIASRLKYLGECHISVLANSQRLPRKEFVNVIGLHIESRLNDRTFGSDNKHLIITIPECGTDAPRIAHGEHLTATREST